MCSDRINQGPRVTARADVPDNRSKLAAVVTRARIDNPGFLSLFPPAVRWPHHCGRRPSRALPQAIRVPEPAFSIKTGACSTILLLKYFKVYSFQLKFLCRNYLTIGSRAPFTRPRRPGLPAAASK